MSLTSVIIPCLNCGETLPEAIESVRRQTAPVELFVVDDGSTDAATLDVLNSLRDTGLTVLPTPHQGVAAARNFGIERASGDYIVCLNADGTLLPTMVEELTAHLDQSPRVGIVSPVVYDVLPRPSSCGDECRGSDGIGRPSYLLWQNRLASESLFRKQCWRDAGGYRDLPAYEDWEFWISIVEKGWEWIQLQKPLVRPRVRNGSRAECVALHHRPLLKRIIATHLPSYRTHLEDILVGMDTALRSERRRLSDYVEANGEREKRLASLRKTLHERDRQISELEAAIREFERMLSELSDYRDEIQTKWVDT
jgi:glycosyltransferase involved in cell wall biosynthesis